MRTRRPSGRVFAFRRTPLVAAIACAFAQSAFAVTYIVNTNADSGTGSLRQAITDANTNCSTDTAPIIQFSGPFTINPSSALPSFQCFSPPGPYNPMVDGVTGSGGSFNTSTTGFNAGLGVVVDGSAIFYGGVCGLQHQDFGYGGGLTVQGMEVRNFSYGGSYGICGRVSLYSNRIVANGTGVRAQGGSTIGDADPGGRNVIADHAYGSGIEISGGIYLIANNLIGTRDGTTAAPNATGIQGNNPSGTIEGNVIVSSAYADIDLSDDFFLTIQGNKLGTNEAGTTSLGTSSYGISLYYSYGASIGGNTIAGAANNAIDMYNTGLVTISGNMIGTDVTGNTVLAGGRSSGIYDAYSYGTRIEGGNVIAGNSSGIYLSGTTDALVQGNYIGTNSGGTAALGNTMGVYVGATGGNVSLDGNTISGNVIGVYFADAYSSSVTNNKIGTTADGSTALANQLGLSAYCGSDLTVEDNVISGNATGGITLYGIQSSSFERNFIGLSAGGSPLPNGGHGIEASYIFCGGDVARAPLAASKRAKRAKTAKAGARGNFTLGNNEFDGNNIGSNQIAHNTGKGLWITGGSNNDIYSNYVAANGIDGIRIDSHRDEYGSVIAAATSNWMPDNLVFGNGAKNINLGFDGGPLPNDTGDIDGSLPDIGRPNNWQNRPVINSVVRDPANNWTMVDFTLDTQPGTYEISIYANSSPGTPSGETYISSTFLTVTGGPTSGSYAIPGITLDNISALATRDDAAPYDTSEFADIKTATTLATPAVTVVPSSVNFGDVVVGRQSPDSTITITSLGSAPYVINNLRDASCSGPAICSTGAFVCSTTCAEATPYSAPNSCTITASFAPSAMGAQTKTLALCDNTAGSPRSITLSGNGVAASAVDITIAPASWYFGEVLVGSQSSSKSFTISNAGSTQVYLSRVTVTGDFLVSGNTCGPTLAGGASCNADVIFVPTTNGIVSGAVSVTGSDTPPASAAARVNVTGPTTNTVSATLQGSGLLFGDLRLPSSIAFGTLTLHGSVGHQFVTINNSGNGTLTLGNISVTGPFTLTNGCGATVAPGASCTLALDFNPLSLGNFNGTLTVISDAPGGSRTIPITAQVIAEARPVVRVNPTAIGFGDRVVGTAAVRQRVLVTNEGSQEASLGTLTISSDSGNRDFRLDGTNCASTLAPQASCFADVFMQPVGFGDRRGQLVVPSNSRDTPAIVDLTGRGCRPFTVGSVRSGRDPCSP